MKGILNPQVKGALVVFLFGLFALAANYWWPADQPLLRAKSRQPAILDLNTVTSQQLQSINGIGATRAKRILDYRAVHAYFSTKAELKKVWGLASLYPSLAPHFVVKPSTLAQLKAADTLPQILSPKLNINTASLAQLTQAGLLTHAEANTILALRVGAYPIFSMSYLASKVSWAPPRLRLVQKNFFCGARIAILDLNTATAEELITLPGIGPVLASRIPKYRKLLGFYANVNQLQEVYGLSAANYQKMKPYLTIGHIPAHKKLPINSISWVAAKRHPYFRDQHKRKALLNWRDQQGGISSEKMLMNAPVDKAWLKKVAIYLSYN